MPASQSWAADTAGRRVLVIGGGLAGLAATAALADSGFDVTLLESRPFLGGRATSYPVPGESQAIDNCQHVLLGCCRNLLDFYRRLGVLGEVRFYDAFHFIEPGFRVSNLRASRLPGPLHFAASYAGLSFLTFEDKVAVARAMLAILSEEAKDGLSEISMGEWLREHAQTKRAVDRFWRPVLISAVNEELDNMAALHGFQVFRLGFLGSRADSLMGIPAVPLAELYDQRRWSRWSNVEIRLRTPVESIEASGGIATRAVTAGRDWTSDFFVSAVPFERVTQLLPSLDLRLNGWEHSPITGIHLWFDRSVTTLPHAALLDRTIQWFFNKAGGTYLEVVVSASRGLLEMPRGDVIALAVRELAEFLPAIREAALVKAHVVKEARATFSARPGTEAQRPGARTPIPNLFLAGDWTRTGWPATMEGAVRSGYLAAEAVAASVGAARRFLIPDPI